MLVIQNGWLVTPQGAAFGDMAVDGGRIAALGARLSPAPQDDVLDASGLWVFPGFIDAHTHFDMGNDLAHTADDFETGTRAALMGGTTCVVDFATQERGGTLSDALAQWHRKAQGRCSCHYAFHMAITDWNERTRAELADLLAAGVSTFKLYMAYDALRVNDGELYDVLVSTARLGGLVGVHCENGDLVNAGVRRERQSDAGVQGHPRSRSAAVEAEAVERLLRIAQVADCPVKVVHLSTREGLEAVRRARGRGQCVRVETCPQYLLLSDERYRRPDGANYVCSPPLRPASDREALVKALLEGEIDTIATDHCSYTSAQKAAAGRDFSRIPNGLPGVEHRAVAMMSAFVATGRMDAAAMCRLLSENPAREMGMYPCKGALRVGSDADVVLWDPNAAGVLTAQGQWQNTDYTPYEGLRVSGGVRHVLLGGRWAVRDGRLIAPNLGSYVARRQPQL